MRCAVLLLIACVAIAPARAGTACTSVPETPQALAQAADAALVAQAALDERDAPVALIARVGTDLSRYGLHYSHVGFAVRDHADGRWTVVHLLNECGTARSSLYATGLFDYFADDLVNHDMRIAWLAPDYAQRLALLLQGHAIHALHNPRYSVIARPGSDDYQNSTAWVLALLQAAQGTEGRPAHRADTITIGYGKRVLGGLFSANAVFTDHPVGTRLSGRYPVVTVRSILRWLAAQQRLDAQYERRDGRERAVQSDASAGDA